MQRVKFCFVALLIMIGISVYSLILINKQCKELNSIINELSYEVEIGNNKEALIKAYELKTEWDENYKIFFTLVKHDKLSSVNASIPRIISYLNNNSDDLNAEISSLRSEIDFIIHTEIPYFYNIF